EAMLLHQLDNLDSKMECMRAHAEKDRQTTGAWTGYNAPLERSVLKKGRHLSGEAATVEPTSAPAPSEKEPARPTGNSSLLLASKLQAPGRPDSKSPRFETAYARARFSYRAATARERYV